MDCATVHAARKAILVCFEFCIYVYRIMYKQALKRLQIRMVNLLELCITVFCYWTVVL